MKPLDDRWLHNRTRELWTRDRYNPRRQFARRGGDKKRDQQNQSAKLTRQPRGQVEITLQLLPRRLLPERLSTLSWETCEPATVLTAASMAMSCRCPSRRIS